MGAGAGIFHAAGDISARDPIAHGVLCAGVHDLLAAGADIPVELGVIAHVFCLVLVRYFQRKAEIERTGIIDVADDIHAAELQRSGLAVLAAKGIALRGGNRKGDMVVRSLLDVGGGPRYIRVDRHGLSVHIRCGKAQFTGLTDVSLGQVERNGGNEGVCCFAHHQLDDMLVAVNTDPLPSQYSALIRSRRLPQNRNSVLVNGSRLNCCWTKDARPSIPRRRSV